MRLQIAKTIDLQNRSVISGAVDPGGRTAFLATQTGNEVLVIDVSAGTVSRTISVGQNPSAVTLGPEGQRVFVANRGANTVSVIDVSSLNVTETIQVGDGPSEIDLP